jgi:hypothetical protein
MSLENTLIAKNDKKSFLFIFLIGLIPIAGCIYSIIRNPKYELAGFKESPIYLSLILLFFISLCAFFGFKYFDKRIKLIINENGIWAHKTGQIEWTNIRTIYFLERKGKFSEIFLKIFLNNPDTEISLEINSLDKSELDITNVLEFYCKSYPIHFLERQIIRL